MKNDDIIRILMFPFSVFALVIFLFIQRIRGNSLKKSLNDLVSDDCNVCATRCYI